VRSASAATSSPRRRRWFSRREILDRKGVVLVTAGLLPLLGGVFNLVIFCYGLKTQGAKIAWVAVGGIVLCAVIAFVIKATAGNTEFFTSRGGKDADEVREVEFDAAGD
jgi:formate hydrogenlyase subunit 3/multisubunit Na+/H+ antiporter MnhD subunit